MNNKSFDAVTKEQTTAECSTALRLVLFTDPLCCWSYAMSASLDSVKARFKNNIHWQICMTGMIPAWERFADPENNVARPGQMGPHWLYISKVLGIPVDYSLWARDPPASSYPACLAYQTVLAQDPTMGWPFLKLLWQYCMGEGHNISRREDLRVVAERLKKDFPSFDPGTFDQHLNSPLSYEALKKDLALSDAWHIKRSPSIVLKASAKSLLLTGYRPLHLLETAILKMVNPP
jgi:predicted DsbA family dithiol-disulfide isomerase